MGKLDGFLITEWRRPSEYKASLAGSIPEGFQICLFQMSRETPRADHQTSGRRPMHPLWQFEPSPLIP